MADGLENVVDAVVSTGLDDTVRGVTGWLEEPRKVVRRVDNVDELLSGVFEAGEVDKLEKLKILLVGWREDDCKLFSDWLKELSDVDSIVDGRLESGTLVAEDAMDVV